MAKVTSPSNEADGNTPYEIHGFPSSGRVVGIVAPKNYLALDGKLKPIDPGHWDQRAPEYVSLNPNGKIPRALVLRNLAFAKAAAGDRPFRVVSRLN